MWCSNRSFLLTLSLILAVAGLPAHACHVANPAEHPAQTETQAHMQHDCPHHQAADAALLEHPEPPGPALSEGWQHAGDSHCCGLDCRCGCSAPVPGLILASVGATEVNSECGLSGRCTLNPPPEPERLLRPPQHLS